MSQLHAVIVEQATSRDDAPRRAVPGPIGFRIASVLARFVVSAVLVGGVALSFAFAENAPLAIGLPAAPQAR